MITNLRHLAERFSRGVILRRHLPKQFQSLPLYVSPEAGLRYWRWGVETADAMLIRIGMHDLLNISVFAWTESPQRTEQLPGSAFSLPKEAEKCFNEVS
jgi:hypothetical protein